MRPHNTECYCGSEKGGRMKGPSFENATTRGTQTESELKLKPNGNQPAKYCWGGGSGGTAGWWSPPKPPRRRSPPACSLCRYPALAQARDRPISAVCCRLPPRREEGGEKLLELQRGFPRSNTLAQKRASQCRMHREGERGDTGGAPNRGGKRGEPMKIVGKNVEEGTTTTTTRREVQQPKRRGEMYNSNWLEKAML